MRILIVVMIAFMLGACSGKKVQDTASSPPSTLPQKTQDSVPSPQVHESTDNGDVIKKEVCESGKDKRLLEVHKKKPGCELAYTKYGKLSIASSSKHGTKHCEDSFEKITKKLEAQKFKCDAS